MADGTFDKPFEGRMGSSAGDHVKYEPPPPPPPEAPVMGPKRVTLEGLSGSLRPDLAQLLDEVRREREERERRWAQG